MTMPDTSSRIADVAFFEGFPADVLETLEAASTVRKFKKNTHIIVGGEESHAAYVLLSGTANVFSDDEEGNEFIHGVYRENELFGELGILDNKPRTANVMTTSDSECLVIPRAAFKAAIKSHPDASESVIHSLVSRIRGMTEDVSCLALMDVYGRLSRIIQQSAENNRDGDIRRTERLTHQELANRVGSSREMISKILKDLKIGGYISSENHRIVVHKDLPSKW